MLPRINQGVITFLLVVISILEGQSTAIFEVENNCLTHATLFLDTKCPFKDASCWFRHVDDDIKANDSDGENDEEIAENTVFQKVQENLEPPIKI